MGARRLTLGLLLLGSASAQPLDLGGANLTWLLGMATDPVGLGFLVFGVVASIKRDLERRQPPVTWDPWLWRGMALAAGLILAALLHLLTGRATLVYDNWWGVIVFGLVAGLIGIVGRDGLKTVLSWFKGSPASSPVAINQPEQVNVAVNPAPAAAPTPSALDLPRATITIEEARS